MRHRNAVLLISPHHMRDSDFHQIARRARALDPTLRAYVAIDGRRNRTARWAQLLRPTLQVEVEPVERFPRWRGRKLESTIRPKQVTLGLLRERGLPVPAFVELVPDVRLDPAEWGDYVVVKPAYGRRGAFVWIHRTDRVRFKPPESYPEDHPGRLGPMLAQRFIHTGPWPVSYRVLSFLAEPLTAVRYELNYGQPPIRSTADFASGKGINIVASGKRAKITACHEPDLMDLARRVHEALPDRPVLGIDLIREAATGDLYVSEVNERYCWTLSNESGQKIQAQFGFDLYREFDPLQRAAEALVRAARTLAR